LDNKLDIRQRGTKRTKETDQALSVCYISRLVFTELPFTGTVGYIPL